MFCIVLLYNVIKWLKNVAVSCGKNHCWTSLTDNYEMLQIIHVNSVYLFYYLYQCTGKEPNSIYFAILYERKTE